MRVGLWVLAEKLRGFGEPKGDTEVRVVISAESGFTHHVAWFRDREAAELAVMAVNAFSKEESKDG